MFLLPNGKYPRGNLKKHVSFIVNKWCAPLRSQNNPFLFKFGDFNVGGQIIQTAKYADDLVLMAKEETVLQGMKER